MQFDQLNRREFITLLGGAIPVRGGAARHSIGTLPGLTKDFVADFGAVGNGTTDDLPAVVRWLRWAQAQGTTPVTLNVPARSYKFNRTNNFTQGVKNATISAQGASCNSLGIGTFNVLPQDYVHSSRIHSVNAGASSVVLITAGEASRFHVGQWIIVTGLAMQAGATFPPNFQYNEFKQIAGIAGSTISFSEPLVYSYKSTWPLIDPGATLGMDVGGPATIYGLNDLWDCQCSIFGLRVTQSGPTFFGGGRSILLSGMTFDGLGPAPSLTRTCTIQGCAIGSQNEIDKIVDVLTYDTCTGGAPLNQSASVNTLVIKNSNLAGLIGTVKATVLDSTVFTGEVIVGPTSYGAGQTVKVTNSIIPSARASNAAIPVGDVAFSNGAFKIANTQLTNYPHSDTWGRAVPGHKYYFGFYNGSIYKTDAADVVHTFTITSVRQDATNTYFDTDIVGALPTPTFIGQPTSHYFLWPAMTISQTDSGPADLTQFAP